MAFRNTVSLGPFVGGLNNAAGTPDTIADNELFSCVDYDYDVDATLVTRPPVAEEIPHEDDPPLYYKIVGFYTQPNTLKSYTIASVNNDIYYRENSTSYVDATDGWQLITAGFGEVTAAVQYVDFMYFIRQSPANGGKWNPLAGFSVVTGMPNGNSMALFKERLWIGGVNTSRLYFSPLGLLGPWDPADFLDVNAGDGQALTCVYAGPNALYLFKTGSTFVFTFDSAPTRGSIQNLSTNIGLYDTNCITEYQSSLFILYGKTVYRLDTYTFSQINAKVDIARDAVMDARPVKYSVSAVADRIVVQYYNNTYIYYPITNTWTQWKLPPVAKWWEVPNSQFKYGHSIYLSPVNENFPVAGNIMVLQEKLWETGDPLDKVVADPYLLTKMYTLDGPERFKRLHWWGIDAVIDDADNNQYVYLLAAPYQLNPDVTWGSLAEYTVSQLQPHTWAEVFADTNFIYGSSIKVETPERKYLKAFASLRFSRIQFQIKLPNYTHTRKSSINHIILNISQKQNPVAKSEGVIG